MPGARSAAAVPRAVADLLRVLATLAVILIHSTDAWRLCPGRPGDAGQWAAVAVDQLCRFCVPLFVLLSGYALGRRHGDDPAFTTREFLLRRAGRIGAPYLLWSALDLTALSAIGVLHWGKPLAPAITDCFHGAAGEPWWRSALRWLGTGGADYHLYFLPIILQCYLLFPLLRRWRPAVPAVAAVAALIAGWTAYQEGTRWFGWPWPGLWSTFPLPWAALFLLGTWVAAGEAELVARLRRVPTPLMALLLASGPAWCLLDWWLGTGRGIPGGQAGDFSRPAAPWYALMLLLSGLRWGAAWERSAVRLGRWVGAVSAASFAIYLVHTWALRGVEATGLKGLGRPIWVPVSMLASLLAGHGLVRLAARWRPLGWLIGT